MGTESQLRRFGGRRQTKSAPIFSHEFIIQNHADIVSCLAMLFVGGLMFQVTAPIATMFVTMQHNVTIEEPAQKDHWLYRYGPRDLATIFFYMLCCVVVHAILQEYAVDKLQRRVHLSKTKMAKFSESGQLSVFYLASAAAAFYIIATEGYLSDVTQLWKGYPEAHRHMSFGLKLFFIVQMAYWIHNYPELYFQKVKREELRSRTFYSTLYLLFIAAAYVLNFTRICLVILALHYTAEFTYHLARLLHFTEKASVAKALWKLWSAVFLFVRLACVLLAVLTFWHGLRSSDSPKIDPSSGNFNTLFIRMNCLLATLFVQGWLMWNFLHAWLRRSREAARLSGGGAGGKGKEGKYNLRSHKKPKRRGGSGSGNEDDVSTLPEADQHEPQLRQRNAQQQQQ